MPRTARSHRKLDKAEQAPPRTSGGSPVLDLRRWGPEPLQSQERMDFYWFKPQSTAIGCQGQETNVNLEPLDQDTAPRWQTGAENH